MGELAKSMTIGDIDTSRMDILVPRQTKSGSTNEFKKVRKTIGCNCKDDSNLKIMPMNLGHTLCVGCQVCRVYKNFKLDGVCDHCDEKKQQEKTDHKKIYQV